MISNRMFDEIQVTVIYSQAILVTVTSESATDKGLSFCKNWTGTFWTLSNSTDPDQTWQNMASDQALCCLLKLQEVMG